MSDNKELVKAVVEFDGIIDLMIEFYLEKKYQITIDRSLIDETLHDNEKGGDV